MELYSLHLELDLAYTHHSTILEFVGNLWRLLEGHAKHLSLSLRSTIPREIVGMEVDRRVGQRRLLDVGEPGYVVDMRVSLEEILNREAEVLGGGEARGGAAAVDYGSLARARAAQQVLVHLERRDDLKGEQRLRL